MMSDAQAVLEVMPDKKGMEIARQTLNRAKWVTSVHSERKEVFMTICSQCHGPLNQSPICARRHSPLALTIYHEGDRSVGISGDEIRITLDFPEWMKSHLDSSEMKDDKGRTWRKQLEEESIKLFEPFMDFRLSAYWSDEKDPLPPDPTN